MQVCRDRGVTVNRPVLLSAYKPLEAHITACDEWIKSHGRIDSKNWIDCFLDVLKAFEPTSENIKSLLTHIMHEGQIKPCSHCGKIPASYTDVNGSVTLLCSECREHVLFQVLGAQEGYV